MNKQNKILLGLLAFIVACTIGYALFSETITINGTATANGDFAITTTCEKGLNNAMKTAALAQETGTNYLIEEGYSNDSCTVAGDNVTYTATLAYPTARRWFTVKMKNTGSITAQLDFSEGSVNENTFFNTIKKYNSVTNELISAEGPTDRGTFTAPYIGIFFETADGTLISSEDARYNDFINEQGTLISLKAGESAYTLVYTEWPRDNKYSTNDAYYVAEATTTLVWEQIKAQ